MAERTATFLKGLIGDDSVLHDGTPVVAFFGRSNVGKSSVLESLLGVPGLVRISKTPGHTQQFNVFIVNRQMYFVDFPGYGFAKMPKKDREKIEKRMRWYMTEAPRPVWTVLIIDAKVGPTALDVEMMDVLQEHEHRVLVVANKADKVSKERRVNSEERIKNVLGAEDMHWYSAKTGEGKNALFRILFP